MGSNVGDQDTNDAHVNNSTIPKWFEDITEKKSNNSVADSRKDKKRAAIDMADIFHRNDVEMPNIFTENRRQGSTESGSSSAKFGRRASITAQILASSNATDSVLSNSKYLVPKLEGNFSMLNSNQEELEKHWKSLSLFQKSHKGRLDSANDTGPTRSTMPMEYDLLSPLRSRCSLVKSEGPISPNVQTLPSRSKSEMSSKLHDNYSHKKSVSMMQSPRFMNHIPVNKSKSSENVLGLTRKDMNFPKTESNLHNLEKHLNEYKLNMAREDILRREIIKELLSENEMITKKINETTSHINGGKKIVRTPSFEDVSSRRMKITKHNPVKYGPKFLENGVDDIGDSGDFIIPELPKGRLLVFNILTTWGDKHYVGLNGIEIFGDDGKLVSIKKISASPKDVNVLPECRNDPRVVTNLLDGINRTQDDVHLWLAPFDKGQNHTITIEFASISTVAMIRIWNYNKSRIHSYRGVKDMVITLDGGMIFKGEIAKACGGILGGVDAFGDTILFTLDNAILDLISQNDNCFLTLTSTSHLDSPKIERPPTASLLPNDEQRPYTGTLNEESAKKSQNLNMSAEDQILFGGNSLHIVLLSNWGNKNMIGLTGIEIIDDIENPIDLQKDNISCNINSDVFDLDRLINSRNLSTNPDDMWCVPYEYTQETIISIKFSSFTYVKGIRLWNYNESLETTYAGVSRVRFLLDDKIVMNPVTKDDFFLTRRAPGNLHYDFVQDIYFAQAQNDYSGIFLSPAFKISHTHKEEFYEYPTMPEGFVIQFIIFSTWGDQYYCGLNGIELFEQLGNKIILDSSHICAYPESINILTNVQGDIRTPDKLIDGVNDDLNGRHSWLAPIMPKALNRIYIVLDQPVTLSVIKIWNYSKTPSRGVKEFGILVDDLLVYNGILDKYSPSSSRSNYRTVAFTDDASVLEQELDTLIRHSSYGQEVVLLNENLKCTTGGSYPDADPALRPFTSVSPVLRWDTAYTN